MEYRVLKPCALVKYVPILGKWSCGGDHWLPIFLYTHSLLPTPYSPPPQNAVV
ncbi:MAG: hypothetical protein KME42_07255 [Tildeniella nuda ZEHNDER 1965/U140]|nr:hypothetical protein [Tildeniella nuda ZEHNDER 1965/U140]